MEPFPVSQSAVPLVFDTLPALKVNCWRHAGGEDKIYTLARLYFLQDVLCLALYAFERQPSENSHITFVFNGGGGQLAHIRLLPKAARLAYRDAQGALPLQPAGEAWQPIDTPEYFAGVDEQGWYWGARLSLPPGVLRQTGCVGTPQSRFKAAVFKHTSQGALFGASCEIQNPLAPICREAFNSMQVVAY